MVPKRPEGDDPGKRQSKKNRGVKYKSQKGNPAPRFCPLASRSLGSSLFHSWVHPGPPHFPKGRNTLVHHTPEQTGLQVIKEIEPAISPTSRFL